MMERNLQIDNTKGVLIILVVIGHFLLPAASTRLTTNIVYLIYVFHMPAFILISGFFAKGVYREGRLRWDRIIKMAWLYVLYKLAVHITEGLLAGNITSRVDFFHEAGAPWYLLALVIWYLFLPAAEGLSKLLGKRGVMLLLTAAALLSGYGRGVGEFLALDRVLAFMPFFYLGYFSTERGWKKLVREKPGRTIVVIAAALAAALIFLGMYDYLIAFRRVVYGAAYWRFSEAIYPWAWLVRLAGYAAAFILSMGLMAVLPDKRIRLLTKLGERTLPIYILHRIVRDLFQIFGFYNYYNPASKLQVILVICGCICLTWILGNEWINRIFQQAASIPQYVIRLLKGKDN